MAFSKYQSTRETLNIVRIARIILGPCTDILRDVLRKEMSPSELVHNVKTYIAHSPKHKKPSINKVQQQLVCSGDYSNFDIVLLYLLLRNVCSFSPHSNKWGNIPSPGDRSVSANIERIRILRNETVHSFPIQLSNSEFEHKWKVIFQIVQELEEYLGSSEKYQESLMALKTCVMDPDVGYFYSKQFQYITSLENEVREGKGIRRYYIAFRLSAEKIYFFSFCFIIVILLDKLSSAILLKTEDKNKKLIFISCRNRLYLSLVNF